MRLAFLTSGRTDSIHIIIVFHGRDITEKEPVFHVCDRLTRLQIDPVDPGFQVRGMHCWSRFRDWNSGLGNHDLGWLERI